jgi:hypothetical protein
MDGRAVGFMLMIGEGQGSVRTKEEFFGWTADSKSSSYLASGFRAWIIAVLRCVAVTRQPRALHERTITQHSRL